MNNQHYNTARREFYLWQKGVGGDFPSMLYDLISKADADNRHMIAVAFPHHVNIWQDWMTSDSPDQYLEECKNSINEECNHIKYKY